MHIQAPAAIPYPLTNYLSLLGKAPPTTPHAPSFFDPPPHSGKYGSIIENAQRFMHALLPPWAEHHVYRTYAFGLAIADFAGWTAGAEAARLAWDPDVWFLAAILHDIGWDAVENFNTRLSFEIFGGVKARELLMKWGAEQEVADEICESIVRHTDVLSPTGGIRLMGALISLGADHDILGNAVPAFISAADNEYICTRWPRVGFVTFLNDFTADHELPYKPGCISSKWAAAVLPNDTGVKCFVGLEGDPADGVTEAWKERRKHLPPY